MTLLHKCLASRTLAFSAPHVGLVPWKGRRGLRTLQATAGICAGLISAAPGAAQNNSVAERQLRLLRRLVTEVEGVQATRVAVAEDGRVLVADPSAPTVWVYPSGPGEPARIGRRGQGPGEFGFPGAIGLVGDSLWAADLALRRLSVFRLDGSLVRDEPLGAISIGPRRLPPVPRALLPDGRIVAVVEPALGPPGESGARAVVLILSPRGDAVANPVSLSREHSLLIVKGSVVQADVRIPQPFDDSALWGLSRGSQGLIVVDRQWPGGNPGEVRVMRVSFGGDTLASSVLRYEPLPLGGDVRDSIAAALALGPERFFNGHDDAAARIRPLIYVPLFRPAVVGMVVGADGTVLLRAAGASHQNARWDILSPDLRRAGFVQLQPDKVVVHASGDRIWIFEPGEELNSLCEYQLTPGM